MVTSSSIKNKQTNKNRDKSENNHFKVSKWDKSTFEGQANSWDHWVSPFKHIHTAFFFVSLSNCYIYTLSEMCTLWYVGSLMTYCISWATSALISDNCSMFATANTTAATTANTTAPTQHYHCLKFHHCTASSPYSLLVFYFRTRWSSPNGQKLTERLLYP